MSWLCKVAGHSFEARYDKKPNRVEIGEGWSAEEILSFVDGWADKTYRCDVCTRCGMVVNGQEGK